MWFLPLGATVISMFAAGMLVRLGLSGRSPATLAWSLALFLFALASACAFTGSFDGWTAFTAKAYYLTAAILFTGFMSLGSVYFNAPRVIGHVWLVILGGVAVLSTIALAGTGVDEATLSLGDGPGWSALEPSNMLIGVMTALSSIGTLVIVVAAVAGLVYHRAGPEQVLVAAGVLMVGFGGALARLSDWEWSSAGQAAGILVILFGAYRLTRAELPSVR